MLTKKSYKNKVTLPKTVDNDIVLKPVHIAGKVERLQHVRKKIKSLGITSQNIQDAIVWSRKS